jgi:hypothetical protein
VEVFEDARAASGTFAFHAEQVFDGDWQAGESSNWFAGFSTMVHVGRLGKGRLAIDAEEGLHAAVAFVDAIKTGPRDFDARCFAVVEQPQKFGRGEVGERHEF